MTDDLAGQKTPGLFGLFATIDAKFPVEDYQRLLDAEEIADSTQMEEARRVREEGLYAELIRRPGLMDRLQREMRVVLTGPTTLGAILSSLQMGFRTVAIEQRSSEVWRTLGAVKTESAHSEFTHVHSRTQAINRRLREVEQLSAKTAHGLLAFDHQIALSEVDAPSDPSE